MKLKKLFLIIFSLCLTLSLACGLVACGGDNENTEIPVASIGLNKSTLELEVDGTYKITATVLPSNATDKTVKWSSDNTSVATVVDGLVTGKSAGSATITAKAGGKSATCAVTVKEKSVAVVAVTSVTLNQNSYTLEVGASYTLVSTVLPANATDREVTWTSSAPQYVSVSDKGVIKAEAVGSATITATAGGKSATCNVIARIGITCEYPVTSVTLNKTSLDLPEGETYKLEASVLPVNASNSTVTWKSSDKAVATVEDGKVTAVKAGTATITATADGKSATCTVTVKSNIVPVTGVTLNKNSLELEVGGNSTLTATIAPANATDKTVKWTTSDDKVATVTNGKVVAVAEGTANITAEAGGKTAVCAVTVKKASVATVPVTSVTLNKNSLELEVGSNSTLTATVAPSDATDKTITWTTSNDKVATVTNGKVVAVAEGTANITAEAGGKTAVCAVTVKKAEPVIIPVTSVTLNKNSLELKVDETYLLTVTISPANATDTEVVWRSDDTSVATVEDGLVTAKKVGETKIYATAGGITAECEIGVISNEEPEQPITNSIITYAHAGEESAAFEWSDTNAASAKVEYKLSTAGSYTRIDTQLIRQISSDTARADILGLKGGAKYDFRITASDNSIATVTNVQISSYDRSGYAHFNYTSGVGGYNDDGTLKSNARVLYVTEENKNNIDGTGQSLAQYLASSKSNPIVIRIIGTVGSATWNTLEYNAKGHEGDDITVDKVVGKNGESLPTDSSKLTQDYLASKGFNTLNYYPDAYNGKKCEVINGISSKAKYTAATDKDPAEYDSCWNDLRVNSVSNITIEGVGEDAEIFQFGFTFASCNSVEVRNLHFFDYTEDACSFEGPSSENSTTLAGFKHSNFWLHHNTFDIGVNYWDICPEQDKHDGDGSTDFKFLKNVTVAYNHYIGTHKTGLVGGGDSHRSANFTFHHNYYEGCDQRMPLGRQANMHMYNNYYSGSGLYSISLRAGAYAFVENCVFTYGKSNTKPIEMKSGNGKPSCKVIDCDLGSKSVTNEVGDDYLYVGSDRTKTVKGDNVYGLNFELGDLYTVTNKLATNDVKTVIPEVAGVMKRKSNIKVDGDKEEVNPPVVNPPVEDDKNKTTYTLDTSTLTATAPAGGTKLNDIFTATEKTKPEDVMLDGAGYAPDELTFTGKQISLTGGRVTASTNGIQFTVPSGKTATVVVYAAVKVEKEANNISVLVLDTSGTEVTVSNLKINGVVAEVFDALSASAVKKYEFTLTAGTYNIGGSGGGAYVYGLNVIM